MEIQASPSRQADGHVVIEYLAVGSCPMKALSYSDLEE